MINEEKKYKVILNNFLLKFDFIEKREWSLKKKKKRNHFLDQTNLIKF